VDGRLVGTITTTRYGTELAWIGMMLIQEAFRRRGIATELMQTALGYLRDQRVECIKLDATPAGQGVYQRLGFQYEWSFHRWARESASGHSSGPIDVFNSLSTSHIELDRAAFGADRSDWLERIGQSSWVCQRPGGFGMLRRGHLASYLGPLVAQNLEVARDIAKELLDRSAAKTFWDVPGLNQDAADLAEGLGFKPVRDLTRMWTGSKLITPALDLQFALSDPGTG
jgi:hypothetical protein